MKMKLLRLWDQINVSFLFLPGIIVTIGILLAILFVRMDAQYNLSLPGLPGKFISGEAEGARAVLTAIAGSMVTIAGIIFSITIVTLVLASSQMGPRLLRNFMKRKRVQVVLGSYVGSFVYCLLVLRTVSEENGEAFVPDISVAFAVLQAIGNIILLIIFINHVAISIQADYVIAELSEELETRIQVIYPDEMGKGQEKMDDNEVASTHQDYAFEEVLPAPVSNYLESVEQESLMKLTTQKDLLVRFDFQPGDFIMEDSIFLRVSSRKKLQEKEIKKLYSCFNFSHLRSPAQDPEFVISQIVEVAVRALSPAINDPFTAIICIDKLGAGMSRAIKKNFSSGYRYAEDGKLRVITKPSTFKSLMDAAFNQIRQYGKKNPDVMIRLMDTFRELAEVVRLEENRKMILHHAEMVNREGERAFSEQNDIQVLNERFYDVVAKLSAVGREKESS